MTVHTTGNILNPFRIKLQRKQNTEKKEADKTESKKNKDVEKSANGEKEEKECKDDMKQDTDLDDEIAR